MAQSWWTQKVGSKPNTQPGVKSKNTKAVVKKEKIPERDKCRVCKKAAACKCDQKHTPGRIGVHRPVGEKPRSAAPGTCRCGAYLFPDGRCRDMRCRNS